MGRCQVIDIKELYFNWLYDKVMMSSQYRSLLRELDRYDYIYTLPMDGNCYEHGIELRYHFGRDEHIDQRTIASDIDIRPCSMLEMMVSLATRLSGGILDVEDSDKTGMIFMVMLESLGLDLCTERNFDPESVSDAIAAFNEKELYLFPTFGESSDNKDLWYQAHRFLRKGGV